MLFCFFITKYATHALTMFKVWEKEGREAFKDKS